MARPAQVMQGNAAPELDWELLYDLHAPRLRRVIQRKVGSALAEDVLQETFLRAFKNRASIDPTRPLEPWLMTIAHRTATESQRRHFRMIETTDDGANEAYELALDSLEEEFLNRARRVGIKHAFASLNTRQRRLLQLVTLEGMSYEGVAEVEDMTTEAVRSALARARTNFKTSYMGFEKESGLFGAAAVVGILNRLRRRAQRYHLAVTAHVGGVGAATATVAVVAMVVAVPVATQAPTQASEPTVIAAQPASSTAPVDAPAAAPDAATTATPAAQPPRPASPTAPGTSITAGVSNDGQTTRATVRGGAGDGDDIWSISLVEIECDANPTTETQCSALRELPLPAQPME